MDTLQHKLKDFLQKHPGINNIVMTTKKFAGGQRGPALSLINSNGDVIGNSEINDHFKNLFYMHPENDVMNAFHYVKNEPTIEISR